MITTIVYSSALKNICIKLDYLIIYFICVKHMYLFFYMHANNATHAGKRMPNNVAITATVVRAVTRHL